MVLAMLKLLDMTNSGWIDSKSVIHYQIPINRSGKNFSAVVITDLLKSQGISYVKDSFKIEKGTWVASDSDGNLKMLPMLLINSRLIFKGRGQWF